MLRNRAWMLAFAAGCLAAGLGAAPATPTYVHIEDTIGRVQQAWTRQGATPDPNAPGWNAVFDSIRRDLAAYSAAKTEDDRLRALGRLYQVSVSLDAIAWPTAVELREELRTWLRPRVMLAWAERRLVESVNGLPATSDPNTQGNRQRWLQFVGDDLGAALRDYEGAGEVRQRRAALGRVHSALTALQRGNQSAPWGPSYELQTVLNDLFNNRNLQATADAASVSPKLANYVVQTGPITRNGQTAYVTAGPFMGFGLMASDDGIVFYNRQAVSSVTPINGFQQQVSQDQQGRKAAKLYQFNATASDSGVVSVVAVLRPTGIQLFPDATHNVGAVVGSAPQPGKGLVRGIAALLGQNQYTITQKVYQGAYNQIYSGVIQGSQQEAAERTAQKAAETNAQLASVFVGPDTLAVRNFEVDGLRLRSRPEFVIVDGLLRWRGDANQTGAEMPKPSKFLAANSGVSADVHLPSIATNMAGGYLRTAQAQAVNNLMVVTRNVPPGTPPAQATQVTQNADFPSFLAAAEAAQKANDPKVQALRVRRPGRAPEFSVDRNGNLVASVHDFVLEVAAPANAARGGLAGPPARVYRIEAPEAEFSVSMHMTPAGPGTAPHFQVRVEGFDPGPGARVLAINENEAQATPLNGFTSTIVLNVFGNRLKGQSFDAPLGNLNLPGFALTWISDLDPTGWMRVVLTPVQAAPAPTYYYPAPATATVPATPAVVPVTSAAAPVSPAAVPVAAAAGLGGTGTMPMIGD